MRALLIVFLLPIAISFVPMSSVLPPVVPAVTPASPAAVHSILLRNGALEGRRCTAEAVGPHALLTAAHCDLGTDSVKVDGVVRNVVKKVYDHNDHMLLFVDGEAFPSTLHIVQRDAKPGESIQMWGIPGDRDQAIFRVGYFEKFDRDLNAEVFSLPVFGGDSGAAVLDSQGEIITVLSLGNQSAEALCFPLHFTPDQIAAAQAFGG